MPLEKSNSATPFCKVCFKDNPAPSWAQLFAEDVPLCGDCFRKMGPKVRCWKEKGIRARSLYVYHEEIRSLLYRFKGCGDVELAPVFLGNQAPLLRLIYRGYSLVPAPSFAAKNEARGFNHVEMMFACLHLPFIKVLEKIDDVKQADLGAREREKIGEHLRYVDGVSIEGKKILFVDDLFTTGSTARACCHLLREHHPKKLQILVMGYTPYRPEEKEEHE